MSFVNIYLNIDQLNSGEGGGDALLVSFLYVIFKRDYALNGLLWTF